MFGTMKKALVVAAVAGLGAVAPSIASADQWYADGTLVGGTPGIAVAGGGTVSFTVPVGGVATATSMCDVEVTADLYNQAGAGHGKVTSVGFPFPLACSVTSSPAGAIGACNVNAITFDLTTPWTIDTSAASAAITGVSITISYGTSPGGPTCAAAGSRTLTGNVTGSWAKPGTLTFIGEPGLTLNPGALPATVNGSIFVEGEAGEEITLL